MVADMTGTRSGALAQALRERIALGDVGSTGALESEAALGRRYGLSRVTVRRALEELRDQGLVESRPGAGWFVTGSSFHQTLALGTFRHAGSAVAEAGKSAARAGGGVRLHRPAGDRRRRPGRRRRRRGAVQPVGPHRRRRAAGPGARVGAGGLAADISRADAEGAGIWATLQRQGHRIESVRQTITAAVTSDSEGALLGVPAGTPVLHVRRVARAADGTPLALSDHRYLAHRFSLEVEFRGWSTAASPETPGLRSTDTTNDGETSA